MIHALATAVSLLLAEYKPIGFYWDGTAPKYEVFVDNFRLGETTDNRYYFLARRGIIFVEVISVYPSETGWENGYILFSGGPQRFKID